MANNLILYNNAIIGIIGGAKGRGAPINLPSIIATATAIDAAIPPDEYNWAMGRLLRSICFGIFSRYSYISLDTRAVNYIASLFASVRESIDLEPEVEGNAPDGEFLVSQIADGFEIGNTIQWSGA